MAINVSLTAYCTVCGYDIAESDAEDVVEVVQSMDEDLEYAIMKHFVENPECEPQEVVEV